MRFGRFGRFNLPNLLNLPNLPNLIRSSMTSIKPLLIFDGYCGFCKRWIGRFRRMTGDRVEYAPSQEVGDRYRQISQKQFEESVWLVEPNGKISKGAEAVFRALATSRSWKWLLFLYRFLPFFAPISEWMYRFVAKHRSTDCRL